MGEDCMVVAPSMIPRKSGERQKTDQRDASSLAVLHRGGLLTAVWVPDAAHEAMRDLIRARLAVRAVRAARQQLSAFLLRHERTYAGKKPWTKVHRRWLADQSFAQPAHQIVLEECIEAVRQGEQRRDRVDGYLRAQIPHWSLFPLVRNLCALRGVDMIAAAGLAARRSIAAMQRSSTKGACRPSPWCPMWALMPCCRRPAATRPRRFGIG
jgi:transposase